MGKSVEWCNTVDITAGLLLNSAACSKIIKLKPSYSSMTHFNVGWTVALFKPWPWATLWSGPGCTYACWNSHLHTPKRKKWAIGWKLTLECGHQHVSIFDEVFNEPVGPLQLDLMALESLPELRTVQERITKLERRKPHGDRNLRSRWLEWIQVRFQSFWDWGDNSYPLRNFEILLESWWEGSPALFFFMPFSLSPPQLPDTWTPQSDRKTFARLKNRPPLSPFRSELFKYRVITTCYCPFGWQNRP